MKHSKLPWRLKELGDTCFVQADRNKKTDPYDIEVMGDDTNEDLYPESQKREDAELIVKAVNSFESLQAENETWKTRFETEDAENDRLRKEHQALQSKLDKVKTLCEDGGTFLDQTAKKILELLK